MSALAAAYRNSATAWGDGPDRLYGRMAELLVDFSPVDLRGARVLDLGSGTGQGSRAALARGARVVAADLTPEMLRVDRAARPPSAAGDATALPFRTDGFDVVLAPFCLNHLDEPSRGVREATRVAHWLLASTYAADDDHPVKVAVETALSEHGWERPAWYSQMKQAMAAWGTVDQARAVIEQAGAVAARIERCHVPFPELTPEDMVAWRTGLAQCAPFVDALGPAERAAVTDRALELIGPDPEPVVRKVIFVSARRASAVQVAQHHGDPAA